MIVNDDNPVVLLIAAICMHRIVGIEVKVNGQVRTYA